ncbi:MAG: sodium:solute symporter [Verrucomicrobia bacterium]|nr:sodium:solute symporter [Verrucomicrobiota bacterium]
MTPNLVATSVFLGFFALVTVVGFFAAHWKSADLRALHEWGLAGQRFGTIISWFLIGGDFYTAYTVIAVPALVYSVGAFGFFALPYTIIVYPLVFAIMPRLWTVCRENRCITAADFVHIRYGSKWLALAIAITGIIATMPYIALQLVGMQVVIEGLGFRGELPLAAAFIILALYTYSSGLRAPAIIAFVKDIMIYIVILAAIIIIPIKLGGYRAIFTTADQALHTRGFGLLLKPQQMVPFTTLALGSALAAFLYPHTMTGVLSSSCANTVRKNAIFLPAYTVLLGFIALLGYMAIAAGVRPDRATEVVPALFNKMFPDWFAGFSFAAIAIGALVPAAIMSIGAANLWTRNVWKAFVNPYISMSGEANVAKLTSLIIKLGALTFIIFLPTEYAIDLQLLGGIWILQTLPSIVAGISKMRLNARGLLIGWVSGMAVGTLMARAMQWRPVFTIPIGTESASVYIGLIALSVNLVATAIGGLTFTRSGR